MEKYDIVPTLAVNGSTLGNLPTENIRYTIENNNSHTEILETFTNGHLQLMDVLETKGSIQKTTSPYAFPSLAKTFLLNCQTYYNNSFYGQLSSMLDKVDLAKNSTTTTGNIKLDINSTSGNSPMGNSTAFT
jgi:hypothetical protein